MIRGIIAGLLAVAALNALALSALAGSAPSEVEWPTVPEELDPTPFSMRLTPGAGGGHIATLTVRNALVPTFTTPSSARLSIGETEVGVMVTHRTGDMPDTIELVLPEGLFAVPPSITLQEGETGSIRIVDNLPMG